MNEAIAIIVVAIVFMVVGYPIVKTLDKWRKEMDEGGENDVLE